MLSVCEKKHLTPKDFYSLPYYSQVDLIAHYELENELETYYAKKPDGD